MKALWCHWISRISSHCQVLLVQKCSLIHLDHLQDAIPALLPLWPLQLGCNGGTGAPCLLFGVVIGHLNSRPTQTKAWAWVIEVKNSAQASRLDH